MFAQATVFSFFRHCDVLAQVAVGRLRIGNQQGAVKADSQYQKRSDQRPTTAPRPVAVLSQGVAGGRRDQNAEVEHGSTSATGDSVAGPVSIEM